MEGHRFNDSTVPPTTRRGVEDEVGRIGEKDWGGSPSTAAVVAALYWGDDDDDDMVQRNDEVVLLVVVVVRCDSVSLLLVVPRSPRPIRPQITQTRRVPVEIYYRR